MKGSSAGGEKQKPEHQGPLRSSAGSIPFDLHTSILERALSKLCEGEAEEEPQPRSKWQPVAVGKGNTGAEGLQQRLEVFFFLPGLWQWLGKPDFTKRHF